MVSVCPFCHSKRVLASPPSGRTCVCLDCGNRVGYWNSVKKFNSEKKPYIWVGGIPLKLNNNYTELWKLIADEVKTNFKINVL